jgi:GT2 family glycosyltransferase/glycosyltransferase involved in cell wall biosynthesis
MQILVLGMHRSGTSMVARLLNMMGAYFAAEGISTGANQENPKGFWERRDVRILNDMLLHSAGADWHRVSDFTLEKIPAAALAKFKTDAGKIILDMDAHRPWFLKEPRFCLLAPLWLDLLEVPVCVIVNRSPIEVARSLQMRNRLPIAVGLALWECYNIAALNATRGQRRIQVNHAGLMADPVGTVRQLKGDLEELGVRGLRAPSDEEIRTFIDPSLYQARREQLQARLSPAQRKLHKVFQNGAVLLGEKDLRFSAESQEALSQHDRWMEAQDRIVELSAEKGRLQEQTERLLSDLRTSIAKAEDQLATLQDELERRIRNERRQRAKSDETLRAALKYVTKLGKWSERLLRDYQRILNSNRWRVGCWLSFKRAGQRSKEAQRLAHLMVSRPRLVSGGRDVSQGQSPTGKREPDRTGGALSDLDNRDAGAATAAGSGMAATPQQHVARDLLNPLLDRGRGPKPLPEAVGGGGQSSVTEKADVIVCVHNALEDVRRCLGSIVKHRSARLNKLILVNDGSDEETTSYLRQFVAEAPVKTALLENPQPGGYTKAANRGLAARQAEYAILLNSDTVVTPDWIERLMACGESDPSIGIIGPISNAATWQSVPQRYSPHGDWAVNELPLSSLDRISSIFSILHSPRYPRVPLVNGFCFAVKSTVIDAIGLLDEKLFPNGYGEENDYCLRAGKAGFSGAIADDCYLFHAKSRSYSHETRRELSGQARLILRQKYGAEVDQATTVLRNSPELARARSVFARVVDAPPCSILFLMNFRGAGGGANSIVQEANGLRKLGAAVRVAIRRQDESFYRERFPGVAGNLFHVSESIAELIGYARHFEFVVATLFKTVRTLKTLLEQASGVVPCYYIQDYEPNFYHPSEANYPEAVESYTLIPEMRCFAYSRWACETVAKKHGLHVHKVEPSLDQDTFFPDDRPKPGTPFVVCAMVRPVTERRSPGLTFEILRRIKREFGERVEIRMFGLEQNDPFLGRQRSDFEYKVLGILPPQAVASLMRESSLFIDASTYQAFGCTGLEAMACRCATILPSQGGISEYAVDGINTLLVAPNDAGEVLRKVRRYISEPQLYQSIVKEGLKTATRYSIERACASQLRFFESLRQGNSPADSGLCAAVRLPPYPPKVADVEI